MESFNEISHRINQISNYHENTHKKFEKRSKSRCHPLAVLQPESISTLYQIAIFAIKLVVK